MTVARPRAVWDEGDHKVQRRRIYGSTPKFRLFVADFIGDVNRHFRHCEGRW